jgi:quercetin dioxygenase-like cupin family protein
MNTYNPSIAPIGLQPGQGEALWFLGFLTSVKASTESTSGRVAVIEHPGPRGAGSPLHVHHGEGEWFYVLEGELTFRVGGEVIDAPAGSFVYGPREIPHTFTVSSEQARFLLVAEPAGTASRSSALPASPPDAACGKLGSFEHEVSVQAGKKIPAGDAVATRRPRSGEGLRRLSGR